MKPVIASRLSAGLLCVVPMLLPGPALAQQDYPSKPIRVLSTEAGGQSDIIARLVASGITGLLGQPVVVENRGVLSTEQAVKAAPDGYTMLLNGPGIWLGPLLRKTITYDSLRDLAPVVLVSSAPNLIVVPTTLPVSSIRELVAMAKAQPGKLNYGTAAPGGSPHLAAELFKSMAGIDLTRVPYKGIPQATNDLIAGRIEVMFATGGGATPHIKSGKIKVLGVTSAQASPLFPGIPTISETGVPGYEFGTMTGMFAPGKTPQPIIRRLNQETVKFLRGPEMKDRFTGLGVDLVASTPEEFMTLLKADTTRMGKVIKDAGIETD